MSNVQAVFFRARDWSRARARAWLAAHGFTDRLRRTHSDYLVYDQHRPDALATYVGRWLPSEGVMLVEEAPASPPRVLYYELTYGDGRREFVRIA